jgi:bacterial/archaeal transporter family-2 protein
MTTESPPLSGMLLLVGIAVVAGALLPVQAGLNAQLRTGLGHPLMAALASFLVGTIGLALLALLVGARIPAMASMLELPWWYWIGGLLGAAYITAAVVLAPKLGAATLIAAIVAGQMLMSLLVDSRGWVGFAQQPLTATRVIGGLLVVAGVLLVQRR